METTKKADRATDARAAKRRYADRRMAERLRERGWVCFEPGAVVDHMVLSDGAGIVHHLVNAVPERVVPDPKPEHRP